MNNNHKNFNDLNINPNINENFLLQITPKYILKFPKSLILQVHSNHFPKTLFKQHPWMILTPRVDLSSALHDRCFSLFPQNLKPLIKVASSQDLSLIHKSCPGSCHYIEIHLNSQKKTWGAEVMEPLQACLISPI